MPARGEALLSIDQGTTGTTVLVLDRSLAVRGRGYREIPQIYPRPGEVEHDPEAIWQSVVGAIALALRAAETAPADIAAIGITNQRETTILWDRATGKPVGNAIVWQDRRTADACASMKAAGLEQPVRERTGLVLDPYFSATKIRYMLDATPG
ncbi:MAG TPA: FGGY family carbohydrate kinase, partial [Polyangia bacterium]|nr:FGGY family carbohydrate kinase [Polyangia bacterium]